MNLERMAPGAAVAELNAAIGPAPSTDPVTGGRDPAGTLRPMIVGCPRGARRRLASPPPSGASRSAPGFLPPTELSNHSTAARLCEIG